MTLEEQVRELAELARRQHYHCDDSWFCCPMCDHPDHPNGVAAAALERVGQRRCDCGADALNARVDTILRKVDV